MALNELSAEACQWAVADAFAELRRLRDRAARFDAIVLDPPRFAATAAQADRAARGYKDINLLAFKLLRPGGRLFTFSCSGGISPELFEKIVAGAALDAHVQAAVLQWLGQPSDHPVVLNFPEGRYLKGLDLPAPGVSHALYGSSAAGAGTPAAAAQSAAPFRLRVPRACVPRGPACLPNGYRRSEKAATTGLLRGAAIPLPGILRVSAEDGRAVPP